MKVPGSLLLCFALLQAPSAMTEDVTPNAVPSGALSFFAVSPCRVLDTRDPDFQINQGGRIFGPTLRHVQVSGRCGVPANAEAVSANVTVVEPSGGGYIGVYPGVISGRETSLLNFAHGQFAIANGTISPLSPTGVMSLYLPGGAVHAVIDLTGYYLPATSHVTSCYYVSNNPLTLSPEARVKMSYTNCTGRQLQNGTDFVAPEAGTYQVNASAALDAGHSSYGFFDIGIVRGNERVTNHRTSVIPNPVQNVVSASTSALVTLSQGQSIYIEVYQNVGNITRPLFNNGGRWHTFSIARVAD